MSSTSSIEEQVPKDRYFDESYHGLPQIVLDNKLLLRKITERERWHKLVKEFYYQFLFLSVFLIYVLVQNVTHERHLMTSSLHQILESSKFPRVPNNVETTYIDFNSIGTKQEYWQWVNNVAYPLVRFSTTDQLVSSIGARSGSLSEVNGELSGSKVLWGLRFRAIKVHETACAYPLVDLLPNGTRCFPMLSDSTKITLDSFKTLSAEEQRAAVNLDEAYPYMSDKETQELPFTGKYAQYPGDGFTHDILYNQNNSVLDSALLDLQTYGGHFLDESTRAVVMSVTLYNPHFNLFAFVRLVAEFSWTGAVTTTSEFLCAPLLPESSAKANFVTVMSFVVDLFILFDFVNLYFEFYSIRRASHVDAKTSRTIATSNGGGAATSAAAIHPTSHASSLGSGHMYAGSNDGRVIGSSNLGWLFAEFSGNCLLLVHVWYSFRRINTPDTIIQVTSQSTFSSQVGTEASWFNFMQILYAVSLLFFSVRIFKYLRVFAAFRSLWDVITKVSKHMFYLLVLALIMLCGFSIFAHLSFGFLSENYNSFMATLLSLVIFLLGEVDYETLQRANASNASIFLWSFVACFMFLLVGLFNAIVVSAWLDITVKKELADNVLPGTSLVSFTRMSSTIGKYLAKFVSNPVSSFGEVTYRLKKSTLQLLRRMLIFHRRHKGWLPEDEVAERLMTWAKRPENHEMRFIGFVQVRDALQGKGRNWRLVNNAQVLDIMILCKMCWVRRRGGRRGAGKRGVNEERSRGGNKSGGSGATNKSIGRTEVDERRADTDDNEIKKAEKAQNKSRKADARDALQSLHHAQQTLENLHRVQFKRLREYEANVQALRASQERMFKRVRELELTLA